MLKVLAVSPADGWACVQDGERFLLVDPCHDVDSFESIAEDDVGTFVNQHGLVAVEDQEFEDWDALVQWLHEQVAKSWEASGRGLPGEAALREQFAESAPLNVVTAWLRRIEQELIPQGELNWAQNVLSSLLRHSLVLKDNFELRQQAIGLQVQVQVAQGNLTAPGNAIEHQAAQVKVDLPPLPRGDECHSPNGYPT